MITVVGAAAEGPHVLKGDRLLEVNDVNVRGRNHQEAGQLIAQCPHRVSLLLHTHKPRPVPCGSVVHSGWLWKKGGTGLTPRNWRHRWFVLRDDCIVYYYSCPEVNAVLNYYDYLPTVCAGHIHSWSYCFKELYCLEGSA